MSIPDLYQVIVISILCEVITLTFQLFIPHRISGSFLASDILHFYLFFSFRHGISTFYKGKSKSFSNLRGSLSPSDSCKDLAKEDNPYAKKRKNALAFSLMYQQTSYQNPTSFVQSLLSNFDSESNGDVLESKRQKQSEEPTMNKQTGEKWEDCLVRSTDG